MACITDCCICCPCIRESEIGIIENCGKFHSEAKPGLHCMCPPFFQLAARQSLRISELPVEVETKTKDNVFVNIVISVQYKIMQAKVEQSYYSMNDPRAQIRSHVWDVVRSTVPRLTLDETFAAKDHVADSVREQLCEQMSVHGFEIVRALVTELRPDLKVKDAMNEINAQRRLKEATHAKAEGEKIIMVKAAEAEAESKYLSGVGVANQRQAIVKGLKDSVCEFSGNVSGATAKDVMDLLLLTQYFDTLREVGNSGIGRTLFVNHGPSSVTELQESMKGSLMPSMASGHR